MRHGEDFRLLRSRVLLFQRFLRRFIYLVASLEILFGIGRLSHWW
jgi:hypothetical protein